MSYLLSARKLVILAIISACCFFSCSKKGTTTVTPIPIDSVIASPYGRLTVKFSNQADGIPITADSTTYTNAAGNKYKVSLLKYYISNFTLVKADGTERNTGNYNLIDASDSTTCQFLIDSVANGAYTSIRMSMGVDTSHNHSGTQTGDLDPGKGMIWSWNTGYIFFKHEGTFVNDSGATNSIIYHYGGDHQLITITLPITNCTINGNTHTMHLAFNLNKLYSAPYTINFNGNNFHESTAITDFSWLVTMKGNFSSAFTFDKVE